MSEPRLKAAHALYCRFRHFEGLHRALRDVGAIANTLKFPAKRFQALPFAHSQVLQPPAQKWL